MQILTEIPLSQNLIGLLDAANKSPEKGSYLQLCIDDVKTRGVKGKKYPNLLSICKAFDSFECDVTNTWLVEMLNGLCTTIENNEHEIQINSKFAAELIAGGILKSEFDCLEPLPEAIKQKRSDFKLSDNCYIEVYCPQESQTERDRVNDDLEQHKVSVNDDLEQKKVSVKIVRSRPLTGSNKNAVRYTTNKTIARVLNGKRNKDQTNKNSENILWLDLCHGFDCTTLETLPFRTLNHGEQTYIGSFGLWHAFYGERSVSNFASDRTNLKYVEHTGSFYKQDLQGLFHERDTLSAALINTKDGLVLYENPWTITALSEDTKLRIKKLFRFRPEFSWFGIGADRLSPHAIEAETKKIDWLYDLNC